MIFLKRIEVYGFKSFAERLTIEFNSSIVGIIGPNGSGKSNINDAIRWVLGEQSVKSLRGEKADDIIFNGAHGKKPLNSAEVTLIFDNTKRIFNSEFSEIQITRKVYRNSSENEYYINKTRVRLKDIQNLVMDTGLSKGSLAIISQGNVSNFADAKPEERRNLFEEAAGVAKYKKQKEESLRKLERSNENLTRINDIISEISRKIDTLSKQAEKAHEFIRIRDLLKKYEISLLVQDGKLYQTELRTLNQSANKNQKTHSELFLKINNLEQLLKSFKNKTYDIDKQINSWEMQLANLNTLLSVLEQQKTKIKEKQVTNSEQDKTNETTKLKTKINDYLNQIQQKTQIKQQTLNNYQKIKQELANIMAVQADANISHNQLLSTIAQKKASLNHLMEQQERYLQKYQGVQTILDNRQSLNGVVDIVANVIDTPELYQSAISVILGNNVRNIIMKTAKDTTKAIRFLKENRAGIATFLPLNTLLVRTISHEEAMVVKSQNGFMALAHEIVKVNHQTLQPAINFLLGRSIICETIDHAVLISQLMAAKYQCISLDGQMVKAGGSMVGGFIRQNQSVNLLKKDENNANINFEIKELEAELVTIKVKLNIYNQEINQQQTEKAKLDLILNQLTHEIAELEQSSQLLTTEYQELTGEKLKINQKSVINDIFAQYENTKYQQVEISQKLHDIRQQKHHLIEQMQTIENELFTLNQTAQTLSSDLNQAQLKIVKFENKLEQVLKRLVETYHLTFENAALTYQEPLENENEARNLVSQLRSDLEDLGYVNLNAIEDYETENGRYLNLKTKYDELTNSIKELLSGIDHLDQLMITKFDETIKLINQVLPETFATLFGGGTCQLKYSNPTDILTTGIEVIANPPGKKISNLNLLSGGEKSLVALAVLFAILKVKPLPLTILDEVEAPLDPANLERFARYVRNFSATTQFIIVTHRPGTMENCDVLYGTTMENQGITKMVNVKLADAKKMINSLSTIPETTI